MSVELEGTTAEINPPEDAEEFETAVDTAESEADQESVDETPPTSAEPEGVDELETVVEAAESPEDDTPEESDSEKFAAAYGITDLEQKQVDDLQTKAAVAFGLENAQESDLDLDDAEIEEEAAEEDEELPSEEEILIPDDGRAWFVVHCYSGYENKVRHSIEQRIETMDMQDKIFDVVVPTEEEIEIKDGKRRTVERRVFPGYILVQMLMSEDSWYVVRNTPGVTGFVGMGNEPTPLRPDEVAKIMNRMEAEAPKVKFDFQVGEKVRIGTGPFADFIGTVADIDADRAKVRVMVSFFGRETPVELDFLHVEKV